MPIVRIENAGPLTDDQKTELFKRVTEVVSDVTKKDAEIVSVIITEIPRENFGVGGVRLP